VPQTLDAEVDVAMESDWIERLILDTSHKSWEKAGSLAPA
jgi:hypothetical protein